MTAQQALNNIKKKYPYSEEVKTLQKLVTFAEIVKKYVMISLNDFSYDGEDCYFQHKKIAEEENELVWRMMEDE